MCYFERTDFACGDHKWGNMKMQCAREWRTGETCGARLFHDNFVNKSPNICRICADIQVKLRRMKKEEENLARWKREAHRFGASIEKAESERETLRTQINELNGRRTSIAEFGVRLPR